MATALERYEKLGLRECLSRAYDYPWACKELGFLLRSAYTKFPKNLQSLLFHDTLAAFRLLPDKHTTRGISAANVLLQAAEAAFPKQKRALAVTEFKHAMVAHKRRSKAPLDEQGSVSLPQDILVHIFSFLDMRSLVTVVSVCWSWNSAASDNMLWQAQYALFFGTSDNHSDMKEELGKATLDWMIPISDQKKSVDPAMDFDWREAFKRMYMGTSWKSSSNRGYCRHCKSIIWLSNMNCACLHHTSENEKRIWKIKPISYRQVTEYLLGDCLSIMSSSDSDSDSDEESFAHRRLAKLWAYPKHIRSCKKLLMSNVF